MSDEIHFTLRSTLKRILLFFRFNLENKKTTETDYQEKLINQTNQAVSKREISPDVDINSKIKPSDAPSKDIKEIPVIEPEISEQKEVSKLDNKKWVKLIEAITEFITEIDRNVGLRESQSKLTQIDTDMVINRLQEILIRNDVDVLDQIEPFDNRKHERVPPGITPNGTAVDQILRIGFMIENRVFLRAKVSIEN